MNTNAKATAIFGHLSPMSAAAYSGACTRYSNIAKLTHARQDFENFAFNAVLRYCECGDVVHLNRVLNAAAALGRGREFQTIMRKVSAHPTVKVGGGNIRFDVAEGVKASKKKLARLRRDVKKAYVEAVTAAKATPPKPRSVTVIRKVDSGPTSADVAKGNVRANAVSTKKSAASKPSDGKPTEPAVAVKKSAKQLVQEMLAQAEILGISHDVLVSELLNSATETATVRKLRKVA